MTVQNSNTNFVRSGGKSLKEVFEVFEHLIDWKPELIESVSLELKDRDGQILTYSLIALLDGTYAIQSVSYGGDKLKPFENIDTGGRTVDGQTYIPVDTH